MLLLLTGLWTILVVVFMALRPRPQSALFWLLIISAFASGGAYMLYSHFDSRRAKRRFSLWRHRLDSLVDLRDVKDDGHLHECFDDEEWDRIFQELQRMPAGSRSLRRAIEAIDPHFTNVA